jgi:very-short-patch-repair endonuclease
MQALYDENRAHRSIDQPIGLLAKRQHGVFTRAQAMRCGATDGTIRWRLRVGRWERLHPRVYRLAGTPTTWRQRAIAACLYMGPHSALSYRAAAVLRGLAGFKRARMEVTVPTSRNRSGSHQIRIHVQGDLIPEEDITTIDGIPVTKPARTLLDLATVEKEDVIEQCLDDALRRRLVSLPFLERWLADPRRKRHRGARVLQRLVDARATIGVTESPLETQVLRLLRDAGLPIPRLQYVVQDGDRFIARLDFAYPDDLVAIEADGFRYHDQRQRFDDERARGNEIEAMGWHVLRITSQHLEQDSDGVVTWVRRALKRQR